MFNFVFFSFAVWVQDQRVSSTFLTPETHKQLTNLNENNPIKRGFCSYQKPRGNLKSGRATKRRYEFSPCLWEEKSRKRRLVQRSLRSPHHQHHGDLTPTPGVLPLPRVTLLTHFVSRFCYIRCSFRSRLSLHDNHGHPWLSSSSNYGSSTSGPSTASTVAAHSVLDAATATTTEQPRGR